MHLKVALRNLINNLAEAGLTASADAGMIAMNPQWKHLREILDPNNWRNQTKHIYFMTDVYNLEPNFNGSTDQILMSIARFFRCGN